MSSPLRAARTAAPVRLSRGEIARQNRRVTAVRSIADLLNSFPEPAMVLNDQRQIVLANNKLGLLVGQPVEDLLGLRPGDCLDCVHAVEGECGCGTTEFCDACGALRAIRESQDSLNQRVEDCRITRSAKDGPAALDLRVWTTPIELAGERYTVFAVRDATDEKRREVLERLFFHDLLNVVSGLHAILEIWPGLSGEEALQLSQTAREMSGQLVEEILAQRDLAAAERDELSAQEEEFDAARMLVRLCIMYSHHSASHGKRIAPPLISGSTLIRSDEVLLGRVLGNLIKNALEASPAGGTVCVSYVCNGHPTFSVHNAGTMTEEVKLQVFQRSFSTKAGRGHGIGTYSVKLFAERHLRGTVSFHSTPEEGTTFTVQLP
ncbi:MAG: HAMP domain-containing histidine kinase [Candidatus Eisenbacteria bacterium]|nr:HAMP domain-containing histidine kinase [Candidatus Eisenbacteria bacterium]